MFKKRFYRIFSTFILSMAILSGCSSSLHSLSSFRVPEIRFEVDKARVDTVDRSSSDIFINNFLDTRKKPYLVAIEEQELLKEGDVSIAVSESLTDAFREMGFSISDSAPVVISGEVKEWFVNVHTEIQETATARASLYIEVLDPSNRRAYSGIYNGYASRKSLRIRKKDIRELLRTSVSEAMRQLTADRQLIKVMSSF